MAKRRHAQKRPLRTLPSLRYEDAILFLWNVVVVPRYYELARAISRGFDQIGLIEGGPTRPVPWYIGALIAGPLLIAFYTRSEAEHSELMSALPRLGVGPALYFFLLATFHASPDGPGAAILAFLTMIVVATSGMAARDAESRVLPAPLRRWLVFPAVLGGATYLNVAFHAGFLSEFVFGSSTGMNILGAVLFIAIGIAAYFFGVIAPRALAGDYAGTLAWALRFTVYVASVVAGNYLHVPL